MKYRTKLLVGAFLISSILMALISHLSLSHQKTALTQEIQLKDQMVGQFLERYLLSTMAVSALGDLDEMIEQLVELTPVAYIHVYDESDNLIVGHGRHNNTHTHFTDYSFVFGHSIYDKVLHLKQDSLGEMEVHYGIESEYQKGLLADSRFQLYLTVILSVALMMFAAYFSLRVYRNELKVIRSALSRIANGDFTHRVSDRECGELVLMAKAVNAMSESLEISQEIYKSEHLRLKELSLAVENSPVSVFMTDSSGRIIYVNPIFLVTTGYQEEEVLGQKPSILSSGENDQEDYAELWKTIKAGQVWRGELINRRKDGSLFCDKTIIAPVKDEGQAVTHYIAVKEDITEYKQVEKRLRATQSVFEAASEAIMVTDLNGSITMVNPAFYEITGYEEHEILGQNPKVFSSGHHDDEFYRQMYQVLLRENRWEGEIWNRRKSGEVYPQWQTISLIRDEEGDPLEYVALFSDITKRKAEEDEIRFRANYDPLTGLANRSLFYEQFDQILKQAKRHNQGVALLYLDLDGFKAVNDQYGHYIGDCVLQAVAQILQSTVRDSDTICRMGGDEFVISLSQVAKVKTMHAVADKIIQAISKPIAVDNHEINIGTSIGISYYPFDGTRPDELISLADAAMYKAKNGGKNRYKFAAS